jgi:hypothetical protein
LLNREKQNNEINDDEDEITTFSEEVIYVSSNDLKRLILSENLKTKTVEINDYRQTSMPNISTLNSKATKKLNYKVS